MSVFLTVLKILGIILLVILSLVLCLLLIVLFVPVRYSLKGDIKAEDDHYDLRLNVTWLLKLFRGAVWFKRTVMPDEEVTPEDEGFGYEVKVFLFKIIPGKDKEEDFGYENGETLTYGAEDTESSLESVSEKTEEKTEEIKEAETKEKEEADGSAHYEESGNAEESGYTEEGDAEEEIPEKLSEKIRKFAKLLKSIPEKAREAGDSAGCKINGICDRIGELGDKAAHYYDVITEESTERALSLIKDELIRILRALRPRKYRINLIYGFDDPALTGKVTGVLAMLFLKAGKKAVFIPDFDNKVLEGDIYLKGRIMGITLIIVLWRLYFNKDFRRLYKRVRS